MLTRKQHELLIFIDHHLRTTGFSPSFEEMKEALGLRSKSGIHRLISALEEREFLRRHHHRARALEVVRMPDKTATPPRAEPPAFAPNVIRGDFSGHRLAGVRAAGDAAAVQLPLYGRIAAGQPIEALRDAGTQIEVPLAMLGSGEHYALEVAGDSMVDAGILDTDTVIIRKGETADNGQIVVCHGGRLGGDAEAAAAARRDDRARTRQREIPRADLPGGPGQGAGPPGRAAAPLLTYPLNLPPRGKPLGGRRPACPRAPSQSCRLVSVRVLSPSRQVNPSASRNTLASFSAPSL